VVKPSLNVTTLTGCCGRVHSNQGYQGVRHWLPEVDGLGLPGGENRVSA
jgi:hypothetical protein